MNAAELNAIVGDDWVFTQAHQLRTYESDGLLQYQAVPAAAVLPGTAEEVRQVVAWCARNEVPWVARGAGSGLSGGALPVADGVLIVLSRLKRILEIDLDNHRVCVEPGVTNLSVSAAVGPAFFYPPDPSSQIVCSIGGNVAENSGGAHCFKYGFTTNYVTGLEVVLTDGTMVTLGGPELDAPGYDLLGAFVGSEGTLGVATKVWLRIVPSPESVKTLVAFFDTTREAGEAVSRDRAGGRRPGRDRDDGRARDRRLRADGPRRLSAPAAARRCWSSSTAPSASARRASRRSPRCARSAGPTTSASRATRPSARCSGRRARRRSRRWAGSRRTTSCRTA